MAVNTSKGVDLEHLLPEYRQRLEAMWNDSRVAGRYYVLSGARSTKRQAELYAAAAKGGPPANRPGSSKHEYGLDLRQWAEATDCHPTARAGGSYAELHQVGAEYGFYFPYANRKISPEDWHMELAPNRLSLAQESQEDDDVPDEYVAAVVAPSGRGVWRLKRDGAIETQNFDEKNKIPHYGSLHDFPSERDKPGRYCIGLQLVAHYEPATGGMTYQDELGYWLLTNDGGSFKFDPSTLKKR